MRVRKRRTSSPACCGLRGRRRLANTYPRWRGFKGAHRVPDLVLQRGCDDVAHDHPVVAQRFTRALGQGVRVHQRPPGSGNAVTASGRGRLLDECFRAHLGHRHVHHRQCLPRAAQPTQVNRGPCQTGRRVSRLLARVDFGQGRHVYVQKASAIRAAWLTGGEVDVPEKAPGNRRSQALDEFANLLRFARTRTLANGLGCGPAACEDAGRLRTAGRTSRARHHVDEELRRCSSLVAARRLASSLWPMVQPFSGQSAATSVVERPIRAR